MNDSWTIFFTITGWIIGLVSIFYAYLSGKKSDEKFNNVLNKLAAQPIELLSILSSQNENKVVELYDFQNRVNEPYVLSKFDIDNDGEDEIFIQSGAGPYSCKLEIYNYIKDPDNPTLQLMDTVVVSTTSGYVFNDIDNDGILEIITDDNSIKADKPYVLGFRDRVIFKFVDKKIYEMSRLELYTEKEMESRLEAFEKENFI
ncbi:FG-GAP repeat domain-containing protein [Acinetobacter baumannii]|nr:VCBS repeat-containing protein [Acinetobacter baumannii]MDC5155845.1 VCBS repeat-containing protein [Acinetobacter baumannii]MDC5532884.1 VCBS repeat-containing protein [Acinetobacter baumannii]